MFCISTSVWVLRTPNAGWNSHFQGFYSFFLEKAKYLQQISSKTRFLKFAPERWSTVFFPKNDLFSCLTKNHCDLQHFTCENVFLEKKVNFFGNKTVNQRSGANFKTCVFLKKKRVKTLKMTILTNVWSAQHLNAGQKYTTPMLASLEVLLHCLLHLH